MAKFVLPTENNTNKIYSYDRYYTLDGTTYKFLFHYNQRNDTWYFGIDDQLGGVACLGGVSLLDKYQYLEVPPGELIIEDLQGLDRDPSRTTFGDSVVLTYTEEV